MHYKTFLSFLKKHKDLSRFRDKVFRLKRKKNKEFIAVVKKAKAAGAFEMPKNVGTRDVLPSFQQMLSLP